MGLVAYGTLTVALAVGVAFQHRAAAAATSVTPVPLTVVNLGAGAVVATVDCEKGHGYFSKKAFAGDLAPALHRPFVAARPGAASQTVTGRGARVVAFLKKWKPLYKYERKKIMIWNYARRHFKQKLCKTSFTQAKKKVMHALKMKRKMRFTFKRDRRRLWIQRVNANSRLHGISYSVLINKMKEACININRKMLSQLGVYDRPIFTNILELAIPNWREVQKYRQSIKVRKVWTTEEIDAVMIPRIEKQFPNIYTDGCIRFNRKVEEGVIAYAVDMGPAEKWREILPRTPELANFNIPDHWCQNSNQELQNLPLQYFDWGMDLDKAPVKWKKNMQKLRDEKALDAERIARGEPAWPSKEGVSRADWYAKEPQSWFEDK